MGRLTVPLIAVLLGTIALTSVSAENFAVVVAGSNQFYNYRHQTDICHSFHVLQSHGVPAKNIIVMIYDDIASDPENPFPGKLFNKPTAVGTPGVDVYAGIQKDYTGEDVTAQNFLNIITGNATAMHGIGSGKVLTSTEKDHVFIFFSDHGGTGIIAFPTGPFLQATDLNVALQVMSNQKMYQRLVFYLEACESGSMFDGLLPDNIDIYTTTASNPDESSWGTYCPPDDMVNGVEVGSCLGDLYSVNWMEDADQPNSMSESLQTQFTTVQKETTLSHVMQYGDLTWTSEKIGDYEGGSGRSAPRIISQIAYPKHVVPVSSGISAQSAAKVDSRDAKLQYLYWKYVRAKSTKESHRWAKELKHEVKHRLQMDELFANFARTIGGVDTYERLLHDRIGLPKNCDQCCRTLFETVRTHCGGWSDYALKYTRTITNLCDAVHQSVEQTETMAATLKSLCQAF